MEGNKSAMYTQAGRSNGWVKSVAGDKMQETHSVSKEESMSITPAIPEPPKVVLPETPAKGDCQTLAMAYVEMQKWQDLYEPEQGINRGTIFAELDLPFTGEGACER